MLKALHLIQTENLLQKKKKKYEELKDLWTAI